MIIISVREFMNPNQIPRFHLICINYKETYENKINVT